MLTFTGFLDKPLVTYILIHVLSQLDIDTEEMSPAASGDSCC